MRFLIGSIFLFLTAFSAMAQNPGGTNRGGNPNAQLTGRFYGKLIESKSGKPVEYASVQLIQNKFDTATKKRKEVVVNGMLTKANGEFSLENVPVFAQYKLKVTAIGFKDYEGNITFSRPTNTGDPTAMMGALD